MFRFYLILLILFSHVVFASEGVIIKIEGINSPISMESSVATRGSPTIYFDQAIASIPEIEKEVKFLCNRRIGFLGKVQYSMYCYINEKDKNVVNVGGKIVSEGKAWVFNVKLANKNFTDELIILIEAIQKLPYNKALQQN